MKPGNIPGLNLQSGQRLLAHLVNIEEITEEGLKFSPHLFQGYIEKKFELRIHVICNTVIACKIDSQTNEKTKIDWRNYDLKDTPHYEYKLEPYLKEMCIRLTKALGYELGIIDVIVTPKGEFIFIECNSQGHWLWIEELTGLKITQQIALNLM